MLAARPVASNARGAFCVRVLALTATSFAPSCVATLQPDELQKTASQTFAPAPHSALGRIFAGGPDEATSHFAPLDRADEALDARLALIAAAESSIDAQYYLWHEDASGSLLLDRLLEAADRGVRVRLLIDGFRLEGNERLDQALDLHPRFELRVFNPALHRSGLLKAVELGENLDRLDHRMHNKLLLVDGVAGVVGGRNVGDEYFGIGEASVFRDFDLLAAGPVLQDLARSFDEFWNGPWTVPLDPARADGAAVVYEVAHARARATLRALHASAAHLDARRALRSADWLAGLAAARARMVPGRARVVHDAAAIDVAGASEIMEHAFDAALGAIPGDVLIVTAYLVPNATLRDRLRAHVAAGGRVRILTNSYVSTNQVLAHAYYTASRRELLEAGVELYELRADAWNHVQHRSPGSRAQVLGLHAKAAVFGDAHVLIGSMNLDPRSMELNTELGVLVESPELAAWVRLCLEREFAPRNAWRVATAADGGLTWSAQGLVLREEPALGPGERAREWFLRLLQLRSEV